MVLKIELTLEVTSIHRHALFLAPRAWHAPYKPHVDIKTYGAYMDFQAS